MPFVLFGVRLLLALVFVVAGTAKLRRRQAFAWTLPGFGVPAALIVPAATIIPLLELAVGALLIPARSTPSGAVAGILLVVTFTVVSGFSLLRGRSPECACFGPSTSEPIGIVTFVRNGVLTALAAMVVVAGPHDEFTALGRVWANTSAEQRLLGVGVVALLYALAALSLHASRLRTASRRLSTRVTALETALRQQASSPAQHLGLPVGAGAPPFDLPCLEGDRASLSTLTSQGRPVVLIFLSAHCSACHELWPDIERWQSGASEKATVAEICSGSPQTIELKLMGHRISNVLLEGDARVGEAYAITLRPSAVVVGPRGEIESPSVTGVAAIRTLVAQHLGNNASTRL